MITLNALRLVAPTGLPLPRKLFDRHIELISVLRHLQAGESMIVSGPGGIGKTAVAAKAIAAVTADHVTFPGGALWIACDHIGAAPDPLGELWATVARALLLEGVAVEYDAERARFALRNILAQRPHMVLALDHLPVDLDLDAVLATLAIPDHTVVLATRLQPSPGEGRANLTLKPLGIMAARVLYISLMPPIKGITTPPMGLLSATCGLPLAIAWLAGNAPRQGRARFTWPRPQDSASAALDRFADVVWPALAPEERQIFIGLAVLCQGPTIPREAALALGASKSDLARWLALNLCQRLKHRLVLTPTTRTLFAAHWGDLDPATQAHLAEGAIRFWLDFARAHPGFTGTVALETDAAGLYGILDWALDHDHPAAPDLARQIDYMAGR